MDGPTHLRALQALELALRTGSIKAAAERMAITPAAAGQRIKSLEEFLGIQLLLRGRSGLQPSPALARAIPHLETAFRELGIFTEMLDMQRGQELHIAAVPDFADLWLQQRLPQFLAAYPNLRININGEGTAPKRVGRIDCEISFGPANAPQREERSLDALFRDFVLPISSPEMDARVARRRVRHRLEACALFHVDFYKDDPEVPRWPQWVKAQRHKRTAPERGIRFTRIAQAIETVVDGAGYALCGIALARAQLESGGLSLPFPLATGRWSSHAFHMRIATNALVRPHVRQFRHWLLEEARNTERWLSDRVAQEVRTTARRP